MNKFWALYIASDLKVFKRWVNETEVIEHLLFNSTDKVIRMANEQEAVLIGNRLMWMSVKEVINE